jgi:cell division septum initiation protein DivIVA
VKTFKDWLNEGETLYQQALQEYQALEAQIQDLEQKLAIKKDEVNQIAAVIGKPPVESTNRKLTAELVDHHTSGSVANSPATIARALTGRGLGGR